MGCEIAGVVNCFASSPGRVRFPYLLPHVFLGPDGEKDIMSRFEREVLGSIPGQGANLERKS